MPTMHEIDYKIFGDDMQYVEVELDPNEAMVAEAGGMMYMDDGIEMETIFGDGSQQQGGFMGALMGAGKRLLTGESLFMTVFLNRSGQEAKGRLRRAVSRQDHPGPPVGNRRRTDRPEGFVPGRGQGRQRRDRVSEEARRRPVRRRRLHHAAAAGRRLGLRPCGRHAPRADPAAGRDDPRRHRLHRRLPTHGDLRHPVRRQDQDRALRRRGFVLRHPARPGKIWLQSLPLSRLANRIIAAAPGLAKGGKEEGSILGGLGGLLDGDN